MGATKEIFTHMRDAQENGDPIDGNYMYAIKARGMLKLKMTELNPDSEEYDLLNDDLENIDQVMKDYSYEKQRMNKISNQIIKQCQ